MKILRFFVILSLYVGMFAGLPITTNAGQYVGCDCASVVSCQTAACLTQGLIGCGVDEGRRKDSLLVCRDGAMKHCTNWMTDLKNCTDDTKKWITY